MSSPARVLTVLLFACSLKAQAPAELMRILRTSCSPCHNDKQAAGKLRLDSIEGLANGGASGAAVLPGNSGESLLYTRITATNRALQMPPTGNTLPAADIAVIRGWIDRGASGLPATGNTAVKRQVDYARDIQPILRTSCYPCHSGKQPKSEFRLDARATAMKGGIGGKDIVPGDSNGSRLVHRIEGRGGEPRMPLGGKPLTGEQIALIRAWIDSGANWPVDREQSAEALIEKHWAYRKPVRPAVPNVGGPINNPIDSFVLARLADKGLKFSAPASKEKLIRRVSLDLTGLPPTPSEVTTFENDTRADAYERLVDRLLASPHYGERWARPWLDYSRYADTNGFESDQRRTMWKYRDWLVKALNDDMPFDRFTIEQLAGDMLPNATVDQKIATGFNRNTMLNEEGGVDKDESYFEVLVDRVNTTSTIWLGSTIGCSQCHNHKYDPFTQKEYYQMMAFFSNAAKKDIANGGESRKYLEPVLELPTPEQEKQRATIQARIDQLEAKLSTSTPELEREQAAWEQTVLRSAADWSTLNPERTEATGGTVLKGNSDGSIIASGENPRVETYTIEGSIDLPRITGLRLEALPDSSLPRGGPGRDIYGNFILTDVQLQVEEGGKWRTILFDRKLADDGRVEDKRRKQLWIIDASKEDRRLARQLLLVPDCTPELKGSTRVRVTLRHESELIGQSIGRFRVSMTAAEEPKRIVNVRARLRPVLESAAAARTEDDKKRLADFYRTIAPSLDDEREELQKLKEEVENLHITTALVMEETPGVEHPFDFVRTRGAFSAKADKVYAGIPAVLGGLPPNEPPNRLGLARWLVSRDNPLTARVAVNRIWEQYFGKGIVETVEDFGSQGQRPSHPELLDWLAVEFMDRGWSMKAIHRLIVTSAAYRQTSNVSPELLRIDPDNKLISRGPRVRLEAEMLRDVALSASGLLTERVGGPSVFPPQPPGVWDLPYNDDQWEDSIGPDRYRRGIYTFVRRSAPYPAMMNFDATSREFCTARRTRTSTPLQALTTLNDEAFFEAAQALGKRILKEGGQTDRERIDYGFRLCVSRSAKPDELDRIEKWKPKEGEAFWTMLGNVLLNLDETLTKE